MKTLKNFAFLIVAGINAIICAGRVSHSMGAKSGVITAPTGADENLKTLGASLPVRDTLMGVVRSALQLASALKIAILNFGARKAVIVPTATVITSVTGGTGMSLVATLVKSDSTKATCPWNVTLGGSNTEIEAPLAALVETTRLPAFSVESLVNALDELSAVLLEDQAIGVGYLTVIDQASGQIKVYGGSAGNLNGAAVNAAALTEDVQYVQTLDSGATQFGE